MPLLSSASFSVVARRQRGGNSAAEKFRVDAFSFAPRPDPRGDLRIRVVGCPGEKISAASRTGSVSPLAGAPSTRSIAPENIHGWRRSRDFSRPALSRMPGWCASGTCMRCTACVPVISGLLHCAWCGCGSPVLPARGGAVWKVILSFAWSCFFFGLFMAFFLARGWAAS